MKKMEYVSPNKEKIKQKKINEKADFISIFLFFTPTSESYLKH